MQSPVLRVARAAALRAAATGSAVRPLRGIGDMLYAFALFEWGMPPQCSDGIGQECVRRRAYEAVTHVGFTRRSGAESMATLVLAG
jgi:hypothetical protein